MPLGIWVSRDVHETLPLLGVDEAEGSTDSLTVVRADAQLFVPVHHPPVDVPEVTSEAFDLGSEGNALFHHVHQLVRATAHKVHDGDVRLDVLDELQQVQRRVVRPSHVVVADHHHVQHRCRSVFDATELVAQKVLKLLVDGVMTEVVLRQGSGDVRRCTSTDALDVVDQDLLRQEHDRDDRSDVRLPERAHDQRVVTEYVMERRQVIGIREGHGITSFVSPLFARVSRVRPAYYSTNYVKINIPTVSCGDIDLFVLRTRVLLQLLPRLRLGFRLEQ